MKKAQVQMIETIGVLIVFMILVVFGFIFYSQVQKSTFETKETEFSQLSAIEVAQKALFMPEIKCPLDVEGCVDYLKMQAASNVMDEHRVFYYDIFGYANITVQEVFPEKNSWTIYQNIYNSSRSSTRIPINIYDADTDSYRFGIMVVDYYKR
jgi:4-hydroxyphenylpyruvate dioxygenase-like putative hemolysin